MERESLFSALRLDRERGEVARLESNDRLLVMRREKGAFHPSEPVWILANEDDIAAQSVVLTTYELRWLVHTFGGGSAPTTPRWRFWRDDLLTLCWRLFPRTFPKRWES